MLYFRLGVGCMPSAVPSVYYLKLLAVDTGASVYESVAGSIYRFLADDIIYSASIFIRLMASSII
jgi:hypothetical protein